VRGRILLGKDEIMNIFCGVLCLALVTILSACGKKPDAKLAQAYFKMAFYDLGDQGKGSGAYHDALKHINQALALAQRPEFYALKATTLLHLGHLDESAACFNQAFARQGDEELRAQISNNYACLLAQKGQLEQARALWLALTADPAYSTPEVAWVNLGRVYLDQGQAPLAAEAFKTAAMLAPNYLDAHFYCALAARDAGNEALARSQLDAVLSLEPDHLPARALAGGVSLKA